MTIEGEIIRQWFIEMRLIALEYKWGRSESIVTNDPDYMFAKNRLDELEQKYPEAFSKVMRMEAETWSL
jgi:hypothetical protein